MMVELTPTMFSTPLPLTTISECLSNKEDPQAAFATAMRDVHCTLSKQQLLGLFTRVDAHRANQPAGKSARVVVTSLHPEMGGTLEIDLPALRSPVTPSPPSPPQTAALLLSTSNKQHASTAKPSKAAALTQSSSLLEACALLGLPQQLVGGAAGAALKRAEAATASAKADVAATKGGPSMASSDGPAPTRMERAMATPMSPTPTRASTAASSRSAFSSPVIGGAKPEPPTVRTERTKRPATSGESARHAPMKRRLSDATMHVEDDDD